MKHYASFIAIILMIFFMVNRSQSLTCFECDSRNNVDCDDPFNKNPIYLHICRRSSCARAEFTVNSTRVIGRSCIDNCREGLTTSQGIEYNYQCCNQDQCNSASKSLMNAFILVVPCAMKFL